MPTHQRKVFNRTVFADDGPQHNLTLNAGLPGKGWVVGVNPTDQKARGDALRYADTLRGRDLRHGHWRGTNNAANYPAHLATRNSSRNASDYASRCHRRRWGLIFLDHLNLLRNLGRGAQSPIHDIGLNLLDDLYRSGGGGWWWRGRRRRWRLDTRPEGLRL